MTGLSKSLNNNKCFVHTMWRKTKRQQKTKDSDKLSYIEKPTAKKQKNIYIYIYAHTWA
jgi:hypothetical protein